MIHNPIAEHTTAEPRGFATLIAELTADHERHIAAIEDFERRFEAWGARVAEKEWNDG